MNKLITVQIVFKYYTSISFSLIVIHYKQNQLVKFIINLSSLIFYRFYI